MPSSVVEICNLALAKIGAPPITSMEEGTTAASQCNVVYGPCRDEVMQLRAWASCTKRVSLAMLSDSPAFEYNYAFQLPADFLDIVRLGDNDDASIGYKIEGGRLLTNNATANIIYIQRNTDAATYEAKLVDLIASRMAIPLAMTVAASSALSTAKSQEYQLARQQAKAVDGLAVGTPTFTFQTIVDARG